MLNIIIGIAFIIGAFSGKLVLIGTDSSVALGVFGFILVLWGIFQLIGKSQK